MLGCVAIVLPNLSIMKKITLTAWAVFVSTFTFAQEAPFSQRLTSSKGNTVMTADQLKAKKNFKVSSLRDKVRVHGVAPRKDFTPTVDSLITTAPAGEVHNNVIRSGTGYYSLYGYVLSSTAYAMTGNYVKTDDAIYLKDPFTNLTTDSYLKLDAEGDGKYVAHLPQPIYDEEYQGTTYHYYASKLKINDEHNSYAADTLSDGSIDQDVHFELVGDTLKSTDLSFENIIGLTDDTYAWYGYGDYDIAMYDNPYTTTSLPSGVAFERWVLNRSQLVNVAVDGNEIYINDPTANNNLYWFKGTIEGDKVTFKGPQYLGVNEDYATHVFFFPGTSFWDDQGKGYALSDELVMNYDPAAKKFTAQDTADAMIINGALDRVYYLSVYDNPELAFFVEKAGTPADPYFTQVSEYNTDYGYGYIVFFIPTVDVDGNFIEPSKIYYNIYFDSETPETLSTDDYTSLGQDMTDIPFYFSDGWDIFLQGSTHQLYYYVAEYDQVGVSTTYTGGGESHRSNIVWAENPANSIKGGTTDNGAVESVKYFDLSGRRIAAPVKGLYLKKVTFADGTTKTVKGMAK